MEDHGKTVKGRELACVEEEVGQEASERETKAELVNVC